jgi:hypothetical protein
VNTSPPITLAERLAKVPTGALTVRLSLARTRAAAAQTEAQRATAREEVEAIKRTIFERGLRVAT